MNDEDPMMSYPYLPNFLPANTLTSLVNDNNMERPENVYIIQDISSSVPGKSQLALHDDGLVKDFNSIEMEELLKSWKQEHLSEHFKAEKITIEVLRVIKPHHLEKLLKNFDMGTQILFESNLENWRESIGQPLMYSNAMLPQIPSQLSIDSSPTSSRASTPNKSYRFTPYSSHENELNERERTAETISLGDILDNTPKGQMLVNFYKIHSKFVEDQRTSLINLIAQYFDEKGLTINLKKSYKLEEEILKRFPTEKLEYYRATKRGRIYNKSANMKVSLKQALKMKFPKADAQNPKPEFYRPELIFEPELDADSCYRSLKLDNLSAEEFDNVWKACTQYRLKDLKELPNTDEIFEKWFFYKKPTGFRLIDMDFRVAFQNHDNLLIKWPTYSEKLLMFLKENVKEKNVKSVLNCANINEISESSKDAIILWGLHGYLIPLNNTSSIRGEPKGKVIKYTIRDSQEAFFFLGKSLQEVEEHIRNLQEKKIHIQPFIYGCGADIFHIEEIFIYFDNVRYKFFNFIRCVDICFKIYYLFNLSFPIQCQKVYSFIEHFFYDFETQKKCIKTSLLKDYLLSD